MVGSSRVEVSDGARRATRALVGPFEVQSMLFPAGYRHGDVEPEQGYLVVVLDGGVAKSFGRRTIELSCGTVALLPAGATHSSRFAAVATRVVAVRPRTPDASPVFAPELSRVRHIRASTLATLGRRLAGELATKDDSWAMAAEGLALQLVAAAARTTPPPAPAAGGWLSDVRDLLHEAAPERRSLGELAGAVDVHPVHLAREFRRAYGSTVAEYSRGLRLEWAATELAGTQEPLADIAARAGFADQSHFTRAFRRHSGVPPGRYRRLLGG